ncbi:Ribonuclease HI [Aminobacter sp. MSH1]|uniref:ribonuclease H family protein n=1 Tax=Aminobacter sp. MSH1 TaxID=374606 RepID=UPI000D505E0C|nr:ribonuclease H [Aminobacter sp. MSH1]AWC25473.1 Ribonuclease HI [Aminobacter sp. MSH1]
MSGLNWTKNDDRKRMARQGVEGRVDTLSKDELRKQADRLLAGYTGPVTKVAPGASRLSGGPPQMRLFADTQQARSGVATKSGHSGKKTKRGNGIGYDPKSLQNSAHFGRSVPPGTVIYCDGACEPNPGAGGWGFVVYRDGVEIHAEHGGDLEATNNTMELTGALVALRWAANNVFTDPLPRLFCDSMYVVNGCNDWRHGWKARGWRRKGKNPEIANLGLWKELDAVLVALGITLEWCKGHWGISGNERADELSLMGRQAALAPAQPTSMDLIREQLDYSARGAM